MRTPFYVLTAVLLAASCSLDWEYPPGTTEGAGGGGGERAGGNGGTGGQTDGGGGRLPDDLRCCYLCPPESRPPVCMNAHRNGTVQDDCMAHGFAFQAGECVLFKSCNCTNCEHLLESKEACETHVHNHCEDCNY